MKQTNKAVYAATLKDFLDDVKKGVFIESMKDGSRKFGIPENDSQIKAWNDYGRKERHCLRPLFENLPEDVVVAFEYQVPVGGRIDCMLFGKDKKGKPNAVHIELKQWSNGNVDICYSQYVFEVEVKGYKGNVTRLTPHPSQQVEEYHNHLLNYIEVFSSSVQLTGIVYCYNYSRRSDNKTLLSSEYDTITNKFPVFCKEDVDILAKRLNLLLEGGCGMDVFNEVNNSKWHPTKRLQDAAARMFDGKAEYNLVGEQLTAFNTILGAIKETPSDKKVAIIVKGGPGTGKSVIAWRLVSALAKEKMFAYYVTRSTSLRNGFKSILKKSHINQHGLAAADLIKNTFDFKPNSYGENEVDAIVIDEAHRIENSSNWKSQAKQNRHGGNNNIFLTQIMSLLYTSRVSVFFIDDYQAINNTNLGTAERIKEAAVNYGRRLTDEINSFKNDENKVGGIAYTKKAIEKRNREKIAAEQRGDFILAEKKQQKIEKLTQELQLAEEQLEFVKPQNNIDEITVYEIQLPDQFRCNGSDNYLDWIDDVLYNGGKEKKLDLDQYEFDVFDSPHDLYAKVRSLDDYACKVEEITDHGNALYTYKQLQHIFNKDMKFKPKQTARIAAGWCWDWSDKELTPEGDLLKEVTIVGQDWKGNEFPIFQMPWETQVTPKGDFLYKYAKNAEVWANQNEGINQIGCIFSMQGWELDYVGIIIGPDLVFDKQKECLVANRNGGTHSVNGDDKSFDFYIKNIYRVLLTRGKKGCFIFACDPEVGKYFKRCMEK